MEQVAHQAVVMQFIIEMAKSCNVDPRGCFRLFFQRAKVRRGEFSVQHRGGEGELFYKVFRNPLRSLARLSPWLLDAKMPSQKNSLVIIAITVFVVIISVSGHLS